MPFGNFPHNCKCGMREVSRITGCFKRVRRIALNTSVYASVIKSLTLESSILQKKFQDSQNYNASVADPTTKPCVFVA